MVITRVEPMSVAKIFAVLYAVFALLFALPMGCFGAMMGSAMSDASGAPNPFGALGGFGIASMIMFPLMGAVAGFIGGLIYGFLYNLVAGWVGGIEVEVDSEGERSIL